MTATVRGRAMAIFGIAGLAGAVLAIVLSIILMLVPIFIAHALYQIGGAMRLQAMVTAHHGDLDIPEAWIKNAKATPIANLAGIILVSVIIGLLAIVVALAS